MGKGSWGPKPAAKQPPPRDEIPIGLSLPEGVDEPPEGVLPGPPGMVTLPRTLSEEEIEASETYMAVESAICHEFNHGTRQWDQKPVRIQLARGYFARGVTRIAFRVRVVRESGAAEIMVAKFLDSKFLAPLVGPVTRDMLFHDAMGQIVAGELAFEFNKRSPPRPIHFLPIFILEFAARKDKPLAFMEPQLPAGMLIKHNNNNGVVLSPFQTPQAFGHFSWEVATASSGRYRRLVVDMQGVGDVYTDPQIHSHDHQGFGIGNQGKEGVAKFLSNHTCNAVCLCLGLVRLEKGKKAEPWPVALKAQVTLYQTKMPVPPPKFHPYTGAYIDPATQRPLIGKQPPPIAPEWVDQIPIQPRPQQTMPPPHMHPQHIQHMRKQMAQMAAPPVSETTMFETLFLAAFVILSLASICGWGVARTLDKECTKQYPFISLFMQMQGITGVVFGAVALLSTLMSRAISQTMSRVFAVLAVLEGSWIACGAAWAFGGFVGEDCSDHIGFTYMFCMVIFDLIAGICFAYLLVKRLRTIAHARKVLIKGRPGLYSAVSTIESHA